MPFKSKLLAGDFNSAKELLGSHGSEDWHDYGGGVQRGKVTVLGSCGTLARLGWELAAGTVRRANNGVCLGPPWFIRCTAGCVLHSNTSEDRARIPADIWQGEGINWDRRCPALLQQAATIGTSGQPQQNPFIGFRQII